MSLARSIYDLIQKERDEMKARWASFSVEQYMLKCERDKMCAELQAKIVESFPADFPHSRKEPSDV